MEDLGITYYRENQHKGTINIWRFPVLLVAMNKSFKNALIRAGGSCDGSLNILSVLKEDGITLSPLIFSGIEESKFTFSVCKLER